MLPVFAPERSCSQRVAHCRIFLHLPGVPLGTFLNRSAVLGDDLVTDLLLVLGKNLRAIKSVAAPPKVSAIVSVRPWPRYSDRNRNQHLHRFFY
jgi:hypothetical protein